MDDGRWLRVDGWVVVVVVVVIEWWLHRTVREEMVVGED